MGKYCASFERLSYRSGLVYLQRRLTRVCACRVPRWIYLGIMLCIVTFLVTSSVLLFEIDPASRVRREIPRSLEERGVEKGIVELDLKEFNYLSEETQQEILSTIDSVSQTQGIPIMLLHAIFRIESDYRFWVEHPLVTVTLKGKKEKIQAVGLGGVVWEFWGEELREAGIAQTRSDLFKPVANIRASAYVLRKIITQSLNTKDEITAGRQAIASYYGKFDENYENKIVKYTSDLFWKRIGRGLITLRTKLLADSVKAD